MATDSTSGFRASARPSSSTSELFGGLYARGGVAATVNDAGWLQAMLDVEAALGGEALRAEDIDIVELGREAADHATPVVPLAGEHRDTPIMGLTLLQPAVPTSFGLRAAGWMTAIDEACRVLREVPLAVQMGGPVGTRDPAVAAQLAQRLGLAEPILPWHTDRVRPAALASALGLLAGALSKVARDVTLSPHLREGVPGRGGSSAIAHKRNPVAAGMRASAGPDPDLGAAPALVDRALEAHHR